MDPAPAKAPGLLRNPILWMTAITIIIAVVAVIGLRARKTPPPVLAELPAFTLRTQDNEPYTLENLKGSVAVINFIFTTCPDVCPLLTKQMTKIQARAEERGLPIRIVSVSVDPNTDTPPVLRAYAQKQQAKLTNWVFLTGPLKDIEKVVLEGFKVNYDVGPNPDIFDITHTEHFVLVDAHGRIRSYNRAANNEMIDDILDELALLAKEG
jgi:protein SCO1/2